MIIQSIQVKNFRSIRDETLICNDLTALVGANGAGKSSFLRALQLFYEDSIKIESDDFYNSDISKEIVISVTFTELSENAKKLFANYLQGESLVVDKVFRWINGKSSAKYHGSRLQNPDFMEVRSNTATLAKEKYKELKKKEQYSSFPAWTSQSAILQFLKEWESQNPDKCTRQRDEGQFFGFSEVAEGYLGRFTRFLYIEAVRDASADAIDGKQPSVLGELMELVIRSNLSKRDEFQRFQEQTNTRYKEIIDPSKIPELGNLSSEMTKTLQDFVPGAKIDLFWRPLEDMKIPMPKADIRLVEDGYHSSVARTGHGLQRAFIMTMLQHLSAIQSRNDAQRNVSTESSAKEPEDILPDLFLAIEEPELYQHPNRQRHLARIFEKLVSGKTLGVSRKTQIIYSTHSPHFVSIDNIQRVRILRKKSDETSNPKFTKIFSTTIEEIANRMSDFKGRRDDSKYDGKSVQYRLYTTMTPIMNEGFFADMVILVEGEADRAAILAVAAEKGYDLESKGFSVIQCHGKNNIIKPAVIFAKLGIPTYLLWDSDYGKKDATPRYNRTLLKLANCIEEDWPEHVSDRFACFKVDLEAKLIQEFGQTFFDESLSNFQNEFGIHERKEAIKNPAVTSAIIHKAYAEGKCCKFLEGLLEKAILLQS